jgi:hypothetical protein
VGVRVQEAQHSERHYAILTEFKSLPHPIQKRKTPICNRKIPLYFCKVPTLSKPKIIEIEVAASEVPTSLRGMTRAANILFITHICTILLTPLGHGISIKIISRGIAHNLAISLTLFKYQEPAAR